MLYTEGNGTVVRHLECHEPGVILHGLYVGRKKLLGEAELDKAMLKEMAEGNF